VSKIPVKKAVAKKAAAGKSVAIATKTKAVVKAASKSSPKPTAKPISKPAAKASAKPAPKVAPKVATKVATKTAPKLPIKAAPKTSAKPAAKSAVKPLPAPAAKASAKPISKSSPLSTIKSTVKTAPPLKVSSSPKIAAEVAPLAVSAPVVVAVMPAKVVAPAKAPRAGGRGRASQIVQAVVPLPPPTSRFADRFAPPRPPTRVMNQVMTDAPKPVQKMDPKLANAWKTKAGKELSDAELFAMPEAEYMNDKQLEFFRVRLQTLKDDLLSNAGQTTENLREDTSIVPDPADRATIEEEHALELRTRDRERKLLKKISQSIVRIDAGDYGFCDETGEPIGLGRLIARPTATLSLEAQQRRELKQKMFGD
jgi:DnaK suppressor protein